MFNPELAHRDSVKTDFILQAIYSNIDEHEFKLEETHKSEPLQNGHDKTIDNSTLDNNPSTSQNNEIPDKIREESLISEVKDILPHLGDGFILKCLQHYDFNSERVINAVLEDTLADSLRGKFSIFISNHFLPTFLFLEEQRRLMEGWLIQGFVVVIYPTVVTM